ncbi:TC1 transposase-like protein [Elysia marginata]|uniref:TC1 transposase-like protein n=1 Tax=Elysia marginata TaxID=1093978 RepID=A0AAV4HQT4_9GAST|nr:TC1 transposase-like protein [Elysia marginata]
MKKLEDAPIERDSERTKARRRDFAKWLLQNTQRYNFIYIDEAGINIWTKRTRDRARRGDRAVGTAQGRRGQNLPNVMNGLVHHELHQGGMTAERFNQFLHDTSLQCNPGQEVCFMLAHTVVLLKLICQLNLKSNTYQLLPPSSPFLNICENAFGNKLSKHVLPKFAAIL